MAPRPKPTEMRILEGTFRADRHVEVPVAAALSEVPPPPEDLNKHGQREWADKGAILLSCGLLQVRYLECLKRYCFASEQFAAAKRAAKKAAAAGDRFIMARGSLVVHPSVREMKEWDIRCKQWLTEMG